jgi:chemotaxis protein methyltransferase CheR
MVMRSPGLVPMTDGEFDTLREIILQTIGIRLADSKRASLEGRLSRRLRRSNVGSYARYINLLHDPVQGSDELSEMVNAVTINKTSFFREPHHFTALAALLRSRPTGAYPLRIWSAGCSTGEEAYSIAMTALDAGRNVSITATDVDTTVLATAREATYAESTVRMLAPELQRRLFLRGTGAASGSVRVKREVREMVSFGYQNLVDPFWSACGPFDVIFCRNVVIYFDRPTQDALFRRFAECLMPGGLLVLGHAENLGWLSEIYEPAGQTMYRRRAKIATGAASVSEDEPPTPAVRIDPGDVWASREPMELRTVLGSCVSACLFDAEANIGGMNHFMLPDGDHADQPARYGVHAMELLINQMMKLGAERSRIRAKVFGGASVVRLEHATDVGKRNAMFVRRYLEAEEIPIDGEHLGGTRPLDVRMDATTGRVLVRELEAETLLDLANAEQRRMTRQWQAAQRRHDDVNDVLF